MKQIQSILGYTYDPLRQFWEAKKTARLFSNILVIVFLISMTLAGVNHYWKDLLPGVLVKIHFLQVIEISFTILLFIEMVGLIFVIPYSIANSIGKQFEILSLILLRSSFKEFSHIDFDIPFVEQLPYVYKMLTDGFGATIVFLLISWYYSMQRHRAITDENGRSEFVGLKKLIALLVLISLFILTAFDLIHFVKTGTYMQSLQQFYLILIFADLLFMLVAFRFMLHYPDVFRYSAFVLVTVFIRMSLMAPVYYNALMSVLSILFAIGIVYFHNLFMDGRLKFITNKDKTTEI
jgi:hypothetical protein